MDEHTDFIFTALVYANLVKDLRDGKEIALTIRHNRVKRRILLSTKNEGALAFCGIVTQEYQTIIEQRPLSSTGVWFYVHMEYPYNTPIKTYHNDKWEDIVKNKIESSLTQHANVILRRRLTPGNVTGYVLNNQSTAPEYHSYLR